MAINEEPLLNCIRALAESPATSQFRMAVYANQCGTPACVFGHYCARPDLQDAFELKLIDNWSDRPVPVLRGTIQPISHQDPEVRKHFGIDMSQANELFSEWGCGNAETRDEAIAYIEDFIARGGES